MTRQVTKTTVKVAKIELKEGIPVAVELPDLVLVGNIRMERAQREANAHFGEQVNVMQVLPETLTYEMSVEDFIKHATVREEQSELDLK